MQYIKFFFLCFLLSFALGAHCGTPTCVPDQTKCLNNKVMLCAPSGSWVEVVNCNEVEDMDNKDTIFTCVQEESKESYCQRNQ